jgi:hypothetical protein
MSADPEYQPFSYFDSCRVVSVAQSRLSILKKGLSILKKGPSILKNGLPLLLAAAPPATPP